MIYGCVQRIVNKFGLGEMCEVSISAPPDALRAVAKHLIDAAAGLEAHAVSADWHKHLPRKICDELGCGLVVMPGVGGDSDAQDST